METGETRPGIYDGNASVEGAVTTALNAIRLENRRIILKPPQCGVAMLYAKIRFAIHTSYSQNTRVTMALV